MRSKRDNSQIAQFEHDESSNAKRVKMIDTEMSIELNHADGDSVTSHPATLIVSALGVDNNDSEIVPPQDISTMKKIKAYVQIQSGTPQGTLKIQVSPVDTGDVFFDIAEINAANGMSPALDVMARRIKVIKSSDMGDCVLDLHMVGQS